MTMKKKLLTTLSVVLILGLAALGILAYLTDTDSDVNVMTLGEVDIEQTEDFVQNSPLDPGVTVKKEVTVKNVGESDAYVRTWFAFENPVEGIISKAGIDNAVFVCEDEIDGTSYSIYCLTYGIVPSGEEVTSLESVTMSTKAKNADVAKYGDTYEVLVFSQAGQVTGFADGTTPAEALNIMFGSTHPWEKTVFVETADELQDAIKNGKDIVFAKDITVDEWIMFSETKSISNGNIITVKMDGLTIDGNGHTLTVNSIESAGNGNLLFDDASNLNISNLTIKKNCNGGAIGLKSGVISNVNFVGGGYGIHPGAGEVTVEYCTFATADGDAIYFEQERDNLTVTGCTFNQLDGENVILLRGDVKFTNNIVNSGRTVNIVSGSPVVTGNNFNNVRLKVYSAATATVSNNIINNLAFEDDATTYSSDFADNTLSSNAQQALDAMTKK